MPPTPCAAHQWRPMVIRIDGNLADAPTITRINKNVPSAVFPIFDDQGDIRCGTTATAGSNTLTRLS